MKLKEILDKKIDLKNVMAASPFEFIFNIFRKKEKINHRQGPNPTIIHSTQNLVMVRVKKDITSFKKIYGDRVDEGITIEMLKKAMLNELIEEITKANIVEFTTYDSFDFNTGGQAFMEAKLMVAVKK
jgi:hypothetical protein